MTVPVDKAVACPTCRARQGTRCYYPPRQRAAMETNDCYQPHRARIILAQNLAAKIQRVQRPTLTNVQLPF